MASGTPVVACRSGGIVDIIQDGVNGLFAKERDSADLAEKINQALYDEGLRQRLIDGGLKTAAQYDYSVIGRRYADIYDKI